MRKSHSPGGTRIGLRVLCYSIVFIAVIGIRENLTEGTGPVSNHLCTMFNNTLMAGSKLTLGIALMIHEPGDKGTLRGRTHVMLGKAAHQGFVSASKVDIFRK